MTKQACRRSRGQTGGNRGTAGACITHDAHDGAADCSRSGEDNCARVGQLPGGPRPVPASAEGTGGEVTAASNLVRVVLQPLILTGTSTVNHGV